MLIRIYKFKLFTQSLAQLSGLSKLNSKATFFPKTF